NWQEADQLARQAFELNPSHPLSKTVRTLILDQKREQTVTERVSQARKLQASGDLAGALSRIEEALVAYPREVRLIQIQETLQRELQSQRRQARRRDLEELRRTEREAETISDPSVKQVFGERVHVLADKYLEDEEVLAVANRILGRLDMAAVQGKGSGRDGGEENGQTPQTAALPTSAGDGATASIFSHRTEVSPPSASGSVNAPGPLVNAELAAAPPETPPLIMPPPAESKPQPSRDQNVSSSAGPIRPKSSLQLPGAAIAAVVAGLLLLAIFLIRHRHPSIPASTVARITVHTSPPGATIRINHEVRGTSNLQVDLPEGSYQVEAELNGYQSKTTTIEAKAGSPVSIDLSLDPALPVVKLSSDTGTGKVSIDDQPPVELEGAQWTVDKLAPGEHKLKFDGKQGNASFTFSSQAGAMPTVKGRIAANRLLAVVVSNLGSQVHVYSSDPAAKLSLDGQSAAAMPENGWELPQVSPGTHQVALIHGDDQYKLDIEVGPAPTLATFLMSGQNIGTLVIVTGEDKARVYLDGQMQKGTTQGGQLRIPNLEPKDYVVTVSKAGFQDLPPQKVRVRKGEQTKLTFSLQPIPHLSSFSIQGGTPGAQVLIDQAAVGVVQPDGTFGLATIAPGDHVIELRKDRFKPKRLQKHFVAGVNVALAGAEAGLEAGTGELRITFSPPEAVVSLTKTGEAPVKVTSGSPLSLPPGSYTLTARIADSVTRSSALEVVVGQSKILDLALSPSGMSKWDDAASWKPDKSGFVHKGGDFVLYGVSSTSGTFAFSVMLQKGHRLQWVGNYVDPNDYVLFQMDENNFYRTVMRNGQKSDEVKIPHKSEKKSFRFMQIRVTPNEIVNQTKEGDAWVILDKWTAPGSNLAAGKFGFYIPGNDQVVLASFSFYADLNIQH
ncbi:MAG TPA: PEGA domain-containing protein, partial [Terriglobales bacterium]|nr:PEGA domain-containing protein [Terriglobales bacterium]